jgi:hypothetical protein
MGIIFQTANDYPLDDCFYGFFPEQGILFLRRMASSEKTKKTSPMERKPRRFEDCCCAFSL